MTNGQRGYTLTEMLIVVAMIGVLSLVAVPSFITMRNSNKMKTSVNNFSADLRSARQLAISNNKAAKLSFVTGANGARAYSIMTGDDAFNPSAAGWTSIPNRPATKYLDDIVYFPSHTAATPQTFTNLDNDPNTLDVIFYPDGRAQMPTINGNVATSATITVMTDIKVYKPQFTITVSPSGRVLVQ